MLKKFGKSSDHSTPFSPGNPVFIVTTDGKIVEGFFIRDILMDLVSLNCSPLDGSDNQGFTIEGRLLKPNWCAGKRKFEAACLSKQEAEHLAQEILERLQQGNRRTPGEPCERKKTDKKNPHKQTL